MTDLRDIQASIESTRADRGFTTDPVRLLCLLAEEVGEVAAEIKKTWSPNYTTLDVVDVANELADVFVLVSALASSFGVDLHDAVDHKFFDADAQRQWATAETVEPGTTS